MGLVGGPVGALYMVVGPQERVNSLRWERHVVGRLAGRVVGLVVLARPRQGGQAGIHRLEEGRRPRRWRAIGVEGQCGRPRKRRAHQGDGAEDVRPDESAPSGYGRAEVMTDDPGDFAIAESGDKSDGVAHQVQHPGRGQVAVVGCIPASGTAVAALIGGDDMIAEGGQGADHLAPAERQLREAVQEQQAGSPRGFEPGFQDVHAKAIHVLHEAGAHAFRQEILGKRFHQVSLRRGLAHPLQLP